MSYFPSWFELCYLPLVQVKSPRLGRSAVFLTRGLDQSQQDFHIVIIKTDKGMVLVIFICQLYHVLRGEVGKEEVKGEEGVTLSHTQPVVFSATPCGVCSNAARQCAHCRWVVTSYLAVLSLLSYHMCTTTTQYI